MNTPTEEPKAPVAPATRHAVVFESLLSKVRVIRERRGGNVAQVFERYGGPGIDEEYRKVLAEMQAEAEGGPVLTNTLEAE